LNEVTLIIKELNLKYSIDHLRVIPITAQFSRSIACELGASLYKPKSLTFFIDVDMAFSRDVLLRVRLNTIEGKQVYLPIVFSEYNPNPDLLSAVRMNENKVYENKEHFNFNSDVGYWRQYGFGMVSIYNTDLKNIGGYNTSIVGWGKEDVDLFDKLLASNLTLFRSVDPGLVHVFHKIECDPNLASDQLAMCHGTKSTSLASQRRLAYYFFMEMIHLIKPTTSSTKPAPTYTYNSAPKNAYKLATKKEIIVEKNKIKIK
jgi:chondroitin sulfate synthase